MNSRSKFVRDILINAVCPYATYLVLTHQGFSTVYALTPGAVFPAGATIFDFVRERRVQALGLIVLAAVGASVLGALYFQSPFLVLAKGSLIDAVLGLLFLLSLLLPRPLVYYLVTMGQDAEGRADMTALWNEDAVYRRVLIRLTIFWGVGLLAEAALRVWLILLLPVAVFLAVGDVLGMVFVAAMIAGSWWYGRRAMPQDDDAPADEAQDPSQ
ncbi:MAG TPA: VC0807 family protein [Acetobacteraceae bacterium]|jgi:hypothetical protein